MHVAKLKKVASFLQGKPHYVGVDIGHPPWIRAESEGVIRVKKKPSSTEYFFRHPKIDCHWFVSALIHFSLICVAS